MSERDDAYDRYMTALTRRISSVLDGEKLSDAASACAMCCAFAIAEERADEIGRAKMLAELIKFMTRIIERYDSIERVH